GGDRRTTGNLARALETLSLHAASFGGSLTGPLAAIARIMEAADGPTAAAMVESLAAAGAVTQDGTLDYELSEWSGKDVYDWTERPTITIGDAFRSSILNHALGDITPGNGAGLQLDQELFRRGALGLTTVGAAGTVAAPLLG